MIHLPTNKTALTIPSATLRAEAPPAAAFALAEHPGLPGTLSPPVLHTTAFFIRLLPVIKLIPPKPSSSLISHSAFILPLSVRQLTVIVGKAQVRA